jgi:hypothetical protein
VNEDSNVYRIGMGEGGQYSADVYMLFISRRERHFNERPPDEGIVDVGVTKYRSYLFLADAYGSRAESSKLGGSGTEHLAHPAEWIGVDDALQSSAQQRDAQKIATQAS